MERSQPPIPQESNSFSSFPATWDDRVRRRNLSLWAIHLGGSLLKKDRDGGGDKPEKIDEGEEDAHCDVKEGVESANSKDIFNLATLTDDIDRFLTVLLHLKKGGEKDQDAASDPLPHLPEVTIGKFVNLVEDEIAKYESGEEKLCVERSDGELSIHSLLNFAEAVAMTKRSAEKLFKVLDMYETLKDMIPLVDSLFPLVEAEESSAHAAFLKSEICAVKCRLGEAAFAIFCERLRTRSRETLARMQSRVVLPIRSPAM